MIRTANNLEVLLHFYVSAEQHPRSNAQAVLEAIDFLQLNGLIEVCKGIGVYDVTGKGQFYLSHLLTTPFPETTYAIPERQS